VAELIAPELDAYILDLLPERHPVIAEMEREAQKRDVPIVGPAVATLLATLARSIGAKRVFEMGSAIGYSTAFFAGAVGPEGKVFYTDGSPKNAAEAGFGAPRGTKGVVAGIPITIASSGSSSVAPLNSIARSSASEWAAVGVPPSTAAADSSRGTCSMIRLLAAAGNRPSPRRSRERAIISRLSSSYG